jgi:hypothetical protein
MGPAAWFVEEENRITPDPRLAAKRHESAGNCSDAAASAPQAEHGVTFAHNIIMSGGWRNGGSKTMSLGLPFGLLSALVTTWFFVTALNGHLPSAEAQAIFSGKQMSAASIGASVGSAATQSVAMLSADDFDVADGGASDRGWSEAVADSRELKPDPAANPLLDSTFHARRRLPHRHQTAKHHRKIVHHHH